MKSIIALFILAAASTSFASGGASASASTSGFAASGTIGGGNSGSISGSAQYNHAQAFATKYQGYGVSSASATGSSSSLGGGFNRSTPGATGGFATGGVGTYSSHATAH